METIETILHDVPLFEGLTPAELELIAGCGSNVRFREGELLFRDGDEADTFYVLRHGSVALETFVPARGPVTIETLEAGEVVGWSWLFPPYRWHFDARALSLVRATSFDGACLRGKCESDPRLGYDLMSRFAQVVIERLQWTRTAAPGRLWLRRHRLTPATRPGRWRPCRSASRGGGASCATRGRSSSSPSPASALVSGAGPVHDALRLRDRRGADLGLGRRRTGRSSTPCAPSARSREAICAARPGAVLGVRGPFGNAWPVEAAVGSDVVVVAGGIGLAPLRPALYERPAPARRVRRGGAPLRQPDARRPPLLEGAPAPARPLRPAGRRHGRQRRGRLAAARSASSRS